LYDADHHDPAQRPGGGAHQIVAKSNRHDSIRPPRTAGFRRREFMGLSEHKEVAGPQTASSEQLEQEEERRKLRRLQIMMNMVMSVIGQDQDLTVEEAAELAANAKRAALAMFPDKEFAYDILYKPRLQRLMAERFRLQ
jgi:hypothetical protein